LIFTRNVTLNCDLNSFDGEILWQCSQTGHALVINLSRKHGAAGVKLIQSPCYSRRNSPALR
jgi:hypothetical protein